MSYEYIRPFGGDDEETFELGVRAVAPKQRPRQQQQGKTSQQLTQQQLRQKSKAACGGAPCPEGRKLRVTRFNLKDPVRLAEFEEEMTARNCAHLCTVGDSQTYCCPSVSEAQEVVTDPFAVDPMMLDSVTASIASTPGGAIPVAPSDEERGSGGAGAVVVLGVLGLGVAGVLGFLVLRKKRKRKSKRKK